MFRAIHLAAKALRRMYFAGFHPFNGRNVDPSVWQRFTLVLLGIGNGNVFQPTIISLQAHSPKAQRAIVISIRNFIRCLGGAVGPAVSAAILQNTLRASLPERFQDLAHSVYTKPNYSLYDAADQEVILNAYEKASHAVFVLYAPVAGICLLCCVFVKDRGLQRKEEVEAERIAQEMVKN
jgi:hypothetical protein